jgi:aldose 1-epimerase
LPYFDKLNKYPKHKMKIHKSEALFQHRGDDVFLFTLTNNNGLEVCISNLGAIIQSFKVPNREGKLIDIVLGFDKMEQYLDPEYLKTGTYLGAIIGRYANRIANAKFKIDGQEYLLNANLPPHQLHGGHEGFDRKLWQVIDFDENSLKMSYLSKDLEEFYPGNLQVLMSFSLTDNNELMMITEATTDKATAINLTHHDYFNLDESARIDNHWVEIAADKYLGQYSDNLADGKILSVLGNCFDFTKAKQINQHWDSNLGYDHSFLINKEYGAFAKAASAFSDKSGIKLDVFTDEPTVHFYTGKYLGINSGKNGKFYEPFSGFCFETQHHCNAINIPDFPSTILRPGDLYKHQTNYCLTCYQ